MAGLLTKHLPKLVWLCLAAVLAACNSKMNIVPAYSPQQLWNAEEGVVVARVINASPYPLPYNYLTLTPKDVYEAKENKFQRISSLKTIGDKTSLFASAIKPGSYSLSDLYSYKSFGNYYYQNFGNIEASFGTFEVEPGKVTDLGTLIYYRKPDGDVYYDVVNRKPDQGLSLNLVKQELPDLASKLDFSQPLGWNDDDNADERHDLYLNMAQNPINYNRSYPQADGSWKFTAPLGMLIHRDADGEWGLEAVDTDYELEFFSQNQQGGQLLSSEDKTFYLKPAGSEEWQAFEPPKPDTRFGKDDPTFYLATFKLLDNGDIAALYRNDYYLLLRIKPSGQKAWQTAMVYSPLSHWSNAEDYLQKKQQLAAEQEAKRYKKKTAKRKKKYDDFSVRNHRGDFYIAVDNALYRLSPENQQIAAINKDFSVEALGQSGLDQITIHRTSLWDGNVTTQYSLDGGQSWKQYKKRLDLCPDSPSAEADNKCADGKRRYESYRHASLPVFYDDGSGFSIFTKVDVSFWTAERTSTKLMVKTTNGGDTWQELKGVELPKHCHRMIKGVENEILLSCSSTTGQFYRTDKDDIDWQLDYEPSSF